MQGLGKCGREINSCENWRSAKERLTVVRIGEVRKRDLKIVRIGEVQKSDKEM